MDYLADDYLAIKRRLAELEKHVDPKEAEKEAEPVNLYQNQTSWYSSHAQDYTC